MGNKSSLMLQGDEIQQISDETGFTGPQIEKLYNRFAHLDRSNCGSLNRNDLLSIPELAINPLCDRLIQMFFYDCELNEEERINFRQFMKTLAIFRSSSSSSSSSQPPTPITRVKTCQNRSNNNNNNSSQTTHNQQPVDDNPNSINVVEKSGDNVAATRGINIDKFVGKLNDNLKNKLLFVFRIYDADNDQRISFSDLRTILKMMVGNYIEDTQLDKIANRAFMEVDEDGDGFIEFHEFYKVFRGKDLDDKLRVKFFN